jgi:predicted HicB family RNase H-like nuclease
MVHVRLEPDLHRRLRIVVAAEDTSVQDWMAQLVEKAVTEHWPRVAKEEE